MENGRLMNRWWVVVGAVVIQLCLGVIYAWSVFTPVLTEAPYSFTKVQTQVIFSVGLAVFALVMILGGQLQSKFPPRLVAIAGGVLLGAGYILAGVVGPSYYGLIFSIGVLGGAGIGLAYVVPIAVGLRWFPDKKGLLTGLAVGGFGFGALLWIKIAGAWGHLIDTLGIENVFILYGVAFIVLVGLGALPMVLPPEGYRPAGWEPVAGASKGSSGLELNVGGMLRKPQFYMIWLMFVAGAMAGLMVIGIIKLFATEVLTKAFLDANTNLTEAAAGAKAAAIAGTAMAVYFALANGLGRIAWGSISDLLGRKLSLILMLGSQGVFMLLFYSMASHEYFLYLGCALIGFNFGGNFALFPAVTADLFGSKYVGQNYGVVFTAYGIGGIVGPILAGRFGDLAKSSGEISAWLTPFVIAGIACFVAAALALMLRPPKANVEAAGE
ncbi:OFA family MFS transporter [Thermostilla marina]